MRIASSFLMTVALGSVLVACGGDDGDGGGGGNPDAAVQIDAAPMVDAGNPPAMGLGARCDNMTPCPTTPAGLECVALSQGATYGFCALPCGTTPAASMEPPMNGTQTCQASTPAPGNGTPICAITGPMMNGMKPWLCGVACGTFMGQNLGTCPGGLVCTDNLCQ